MKHTQTKQATAVDANSTAVNPVKRLSAAELKEIVSDPNRWVDDKIAQYVIPIKTATLRKLRCEGRGPQFARFGSSCRYKVAWLLEYAEARVVQTRDYAAPHQEASKHA